MVEQLGLARIHLDIMDGHFVPNLSFGPQVVAALRPGSKLFFEMDQDRNLKLADGYWGFTYVDPLLDPTSPYAGQYALSYTLAGAGMTQLQLDFTKQIGYLLRRAYQRHTGIFQQTVPESRLTAAQFVVMLTVRDRGSCEIPAIVQHTAIDDASLRGIVERLKWRKLLNAEHEPGDARKMVVSLTPAGQELLDQTVPFAQEITELTYGDLSPQERSTLVALLNKMNGTGA